VAETPDLTLAEIAVHLQRAHGLRVALSTVRRFSERHGVSVKKKPRGSASKSGLTSFCYGMPGSRPSPISTPTG